MKPVLYVDLGESLEHLAVCNTTSCIIANLGCQGLFQLPLLPEKLPQYASSASELLTTLKGLSVYGKT